MEEHATQQVRDRHRYGGRTWHSDGALLLLDQLRGLRASSFPELAVTAYLPVAEETRWGQPADVLRDLAHERRTTLDPAQERALERELPALRRALEGDWRGAGTVAVFSHLPLVLAIGLRSVVAPRLVVAEHVELRPLDAELADRPPSLVVVADKETARIFASVLDRVTRLADLTGLPIHHHRQGGTSAEQWQRRQEEHAERNLALVARRVEAIARAHDGLHVIRVAAPPEAMAMLLEHLPEDLRARVRPEPALSAYVSDGAVEEHLLG